MPGKLNPPASTTARLRALLESRASRLDRRRLLEELDILQQELEWQHQEVATARAEERQAYSRFVELYDFAPNGYCTLDAAGVVLHCNLTTAALLGQVRDRIEGYPLGAFVLPASRPMWLEFLRRCRAGSLAPIEAELEFRTSDGERPLQLYCRPRPPRRHIPSEFFTALVDVTERRLLEKEHEQAVADQLALSGRLIAIQEEERRRIAQDLHDDLGQQVTALRLKLADLAGVAGNGPVHRRLTEIDRLTADLDSRLHFIATELRPGALNLGIVSALEQYLDNWGSTYGIAADFCAVGLDNVEFETDVDTHLYRIVQEALNNVHKHAGAAHVSVLLERRGARIVLVIEDDGRGFQRGAAGTGGVGLLGMRERAQLMHGQLEVESHPGRGTTIFVRIDGGFQAPPAAGSADAEV